MPAQEPEEIPVTEDSYVWAGQLMEIVSVLKRVRDFANTTAANLELVRTAIIDLRQRVKALEDRFPPP